jgi:DNA helicase II / ATP-dependent DNA helicase PcrA
MELTKQQIKVIQDVQGHSIILAGPGSGKTRTIIEKIIYIFENKIIPEPFGILTITFTNSASNEMKARLRQKGLLEWDRITIATFHSFSRYLLSCYGSDIGISENFQIADSKKQEEIIEKIKPGIQKQQINPLLSAIEAQKKQGVYPSVNDEKLNPSFRNIYSDYQNKLHEENLLDFQDLIHFSIELLNKSSLAARVFLNFYKYIFVDEFQDTDHRQLELIKILSKTAIGSTIVADDDQSVFRWRGADNRNIKVIQQFLNSTTYHLGVNFRSDQAIVEAANAVICQNKNRVDKQINSNSQRRGKIFLNTFNSEEEEARYISSKIREYKSSGFVNDYGQISIIVRKRYRANDVIKALDKERITWIDRSKFNYDEGWETNFALNIIGQACEPNSSIRYNELLTSIDISNIVNYDEAINFLELLRVDICKEIPCNPSIKEINEVLNRCRFWEILERNCWSDTDHQARKKNIDTLLLNIESFSKEHKLTLIETINHLAGIGAVQVLSGQESKGREFDIVFFCGLEDGIIPDYRAHDEEQISEERRIFYVAMTRAKREVHLTYSCICKTSSGSTRQCKKSRFIDAIPLELINDK